MDVLDYLLDDRAFGDAVLGGTGDDCRGNVYCLSCHRPWADPPFLFLAMAHHIRGHRERYPAHRFRFYCSQHKRFHQRGALRMTPDLKGAPAAVGACLSCNQVFLMTPASLNCQFCGQPGAVAIRLGESTGATAEVGADTQPAQAPAPPPAPFTGPCPNCQAQLDITVTPDYVEITLAPTETDASEAPALTPPASDEDLPLPVRDAGANPTPAPASTPPATGVPAWNDVTREEAAP